MATYPGSNDPSEIAFGDLNVGQRVRFRRPGVQFDEDDGGYMEPMTIEGTITYVNPRGEVSLKDPVYEGGDPEEYYIAKQPAEPHLLEDGVFGDWYWEIEILS